MDALLSPQILLEDSAADVSFMAALSTDASGAVVSPVDGAASATASDDAVPADDSRAPTAPLSGVAEGTVPLVAGAAFDTASDDAAADDSRAPTAPLRGVAEGTVPLVVGAAFDAAVSSAGAGVLAAPPTDAVGETVPPVAGAAAGSAAGAAPHDRPLFRCRQQRATRYCSLPQEPLQQPLRGISTIGDNGGTEVAPSETFLAVMAGLFGSGFSRTMWRCRCSLCWTTAVGTDGSGTCCSGTCG